MNILPYNINTTRPQVGFKGQAELAILLRGFPEKKYDPEPIASAFWNMSEGEIRAFVEGNIIADTALHRRKGKIIDEKTKSNIIKNYKLYRTGTRSPKEREIRVQAFIAGFNTAEAAYKNRTIRGMRNKLYDVLLVRGLVKIYDSQRYKQ